MDPLGAMTVIPGVYDAGITSFPSAPSPWPRPDFMRSTCSATFNLAQAGSALIAESSSRSDRSSLVPWACTSCCMMSITESDPSSRASSASGCASHGLASRTLTCRGHTPRMAWWCQ